MATLESSTRLQQICEPIFLEIANFNRYAEESRTFDLRPAIKAQFAKAEREAEQDALLASLWTQVKKPLTYFVDDFVVTHPLAASHPGLASWQGQILEDEWYNTQQGGLDFYNLLAQALQDHHPEVVGRLLIFQTCLGLGFTGQFRGDSQSVKTEMSKVTQRIARLTGSAEIDPRAHINPAAYFALPRDLRLKPTRWLWWVAAAFLVLIIGVGIFYYYEFKTGKQELTDVLKEINK